MLESLNKKLENLEQASSEITNSNLSEVTKEVALEAIRKEMFEIRMQLHRIQELEQDHTDYMETHRSHK